jgi:hypothetical protein
LPTVASPQPPKLASQPQSNLPPASPIASSGVTHPPMSKAPERLGSRRTSVGEPQPRERSELPPTAPATFTTRETSPDGQPRTTSRPVFDLSFHERTSLGAACSYASRPLKNEP